jgi:hypothetical protein
MVACAVSTALGSTRSATNRTFFGMAIVKRWSPLTLRSEGRGYPVMLMASLPAPCATTVKLDLLALGAVEQTSVTVLTVVFRDFTAGSVKVQLGRNAAPTIDMAIATVINQADPLRGERRTAASSVEGRVMSRHPHQQQPRGACWAAP